MQILPPHTHTLNILFYWLNLNLNLCWNLSSFFCWIKLWNLCKLLCIMWRYTHANFFIIKSFWFFLQWNTIHNYWLFYLLKQPPHFTYPLIKSTKLFRKANSVGIKFMTDSNWTDIKQMKKLINQSKKYEILEKILAFIFMFFLPHHFTFSLRRVKKSH